MDRFVNLCMRIDATALDNEHYERLQDKLIEMARSEATKFLDHPQIVSKLLEHKFDAVRFRIACICVENWKYLPEAIAELRKLALIERNWLSIGSRAQLILYLWDNDREFLETEMFNFQERFFNSP